MLLFYFDTDIFKKKIPRVEIYIALDFRRIFHGTGNHVPESSGTSDQAPRHPEQHECALCGMHRVRRHHLDGADIHRIQADNENQGLDTGDRDAGEEGAGVGGRGGTRVAPVRV